jgi:D-arabinose 5-phosphate isomerase GutQ
MMPCASTLGVIAAFDAIILAAMRLNGFTKEQFLRIHPGGATGETLRGRAGDQPG